MTAEEERRTHAIAQTVKYRADFPLFSVQHLKIEPKDPFQPLIPFKFNKAQEYVHMRLQKQLAETGKIRAIILKGRQQGMSTYVGARYYHRASLFKGTKVYILSHEQTASDTLFGMVDRYNTHNDLSPHVGTSNAKELVFDVLGSQYRVATAGAKAGGRSQMNTLFHGSEVAFWPNAELHFASSVQTVPDLPGTEIILESTANGASGEFYERWQNAEKGCDADGNPVDYIAIFVPWFWQDEYSREVDADFQLSDEPDDSGISDQEYMKFYGLTLEQMAWRRFKIQELGSRAKFRQEYPATPSEAFIASSEDSLIEPHLVLRARKAKDIEGYGPLIIGADPAGPGGDRFAVAARRGAKVLWTKHRNKIDTVKAAHWLRQLAEEHKPDVLYVDAGGIGHAVISMLKTFDSTTKIVKPVNFGSTSEFKNATPKVPGPVKRRDEMWARLKDWLELEEGVALPDVDELSSDLTAVQIRPSLNNDLKLESKDQMRARGVRSPDLGDAIALTFASIRHTTVMETPAKKPAAFDDDATDPAVAGDEYYGSSSNSWMG